MLVAGGALLWRATQRGGALDAPTSARSYVTRVGQRDSVRLADGSRIVLVPACRLVVAADYGMTGRDVSLEGEATEKEIIAFARERLAAYKCPKTVDVVKELPRNPTGKILKKDLRQPHWEAAGRKV